MSDHINTVDGITLEEMPNGLFLHSDKHTVLISSKEQAEAVIESLTRMLEVIDE